MLDISPKTSLYHTHLYTISPTTILYHTHLYTMSDMSPKTILYHTHLYTYHDKYVIYIHLTSHLKVMFFYHTYYTSCDHIHPTPHSPIYIPHLLYTMWTYPPYTTLTYIHTTLTIHHVTMSTLHHTHLYTKLHVSQPQLINYMFQMKDINTHLYSTLPNTFTVKFLGYFLFIRLKYIMSTYVNLRTKCLYILWSTHLHFIIKHCKVKYGHGSRQF